MPQRTGEHDRLQATFLAGLRCSMPCARCSRLSRYKLSHCVVRRPLASDFSHWAALLTPKLCLERNAFDSVFNAQFYKDNAAPAPMVPDHAVLEWGSLHRQLMQEGDGDLRQTLRSLKSHSDLVELLPSSHAAGKSNA